MLFTPHDDNIMLLMPGKPMLIRYHETLMCADPSCLGKNIEHLTGLMRFMMYFVLRFLPLIIMCIIVYAL